MLKKMLKRINERGQSFTELGISLVFLMILLAGVVDLGRAFFTFISLRDAVQEGASYLVMAPLVVDGASNAYLDCDGAFKRIRDHSDNPVNLNDAANVKIGIVVSRATVSTYSHSCTEGSPYTLLASNVCPGDQVKVTITYPNFVITMPFIGTFLGKQTFTLSTEVTDSILTDPLPNIPDKATDPCNSIP